MIFPVAVGIVEHEITDAGGGSQTFGHLLIGFIQACPKCGQIALIQITIKWIQLTQALGQQAGNFFCVMRIQPDVGILLTVSVAVAVAVSVAVDTDVIGICLLMMAMRMIIMV